ncbi:predicted protein [Streptomyces albidoflavus]|nr:predicted protein [Streptomyces albidoflavus]
MTTGRRSRLTPRALCPKDRGARTSTRGVDVGACEVDPVTRIAIRSVRDRRPTG